MSTPPPPRTSARPSMPWSPPQRGRVACAASPCAQHLHTSALPLRRTSSSSSCTLAVCASSMEPVQEHFSSMRQSPNTRRASCSCCGCLVSCASNLAHNTLSSEKHVYCSLCSSPNSAPAMNCPRPAERLDCTVQHPGKDERAAWAALPHSPAHLHAALIEALVGQLSPLAAVLCEDRPRQPLPYALACVSAPWQWLCARLGRRPSQCPPSQRRVVGPTRSSCAPPPSPHTASPARCSLAGSRRPLIQQGEHHAPQAGCVEPHVQLVDCAA